jgi:hypothetical protein
VCFGENYYPNLNINTSESAIIDLITSHSTLKEHTYHKILTISLNLNKKYLLNMK